MIEEFPPMPELVEVGHGEARTGERWSLRVGWVSPDDFYTIIEIGRLNGLREGGGPGGPALGAGEMIRVSTGLVGSNLLYVVGRVDPGIRRVRVELDDPAEPSMELTPLGDPATYGMRFIAIVLPRGMRLTRIVAIAENGAEVEAETRFRSARDFAALQQHTDASPPER